LVVWMHSTVGPLPTFLGLSLILVSAFHEARPVEEVLVVLLMEQLAGRLAILVDGRDRIDVDVHGW
jgi:hypothetical protein